MKGGAGVQALARCGADGSKLWFNCSPDIPEHWFRKERLLNAGFAGAGSWGTSTETRTADDRNNFQTNKTYLR